MAGPNVFHVEFGINETQLSRALENGDYNKARTLIMDNSHTSFLDEGCYQRTPLFIVLSGEPEFQSRMTRAPRHLQLAKLLVQHGANVNHRVPTTCFGSEYMDPGQSALQLVVQLYNRLTQRTHLSDSSWSAVTEDHTHNKCHKPYGSFSEPQVTSSVTVKFFTEDDSLGQEFIQLSSQRNMDIKQDQMVMSIEEPDKTATLQPETQEMWSAKDEPVLGLDGERVESCEELTEQLIELAFIMLAHGADTGLRDEHRMTVLHHTAIHSCNSRLLQLFVDSGADLNALNCLASTPLCSMCQTLPYGSSEFCDLWGYEASPYERSKYIMMGKQDFLQTLLGHKDIKVDLADKEGRTPLFHCMLRGDMDSAATLLQHRADPSFKGSVATPSGQQRVSALFASLCGCAVVSSEEEHHKDHRGANTHFMAHLVDAGHFSQPAILEELHTFLRTLCPNLQHLTSLGPQLLPLMFGGVTSSLRQLCTRALFQGYVQGIDVAGTDEGVPAVSAYGWYLSDLEASRGMHTLVSRLGLPADSTEYLDVELFREILCNQARQWQWFTPDCDLDSSSDSSQGDSDLEYW